MAGRNAQKADVILKDFWRQNERFADLFNAVIFRGKQVIKPEDLTERDTDMSGIIQFKDYRKTLERTRVVVKHFCNTLFENSPGISSFKWCFPIIVGMRTDMIVPYVHISV